MGPGPLPGTLDLIQLVYDRRSLNLKLPDYVFVFYKPRLSRIKTVRFRCLVTNDERSKEFDGRTDRKTSYLEVEKEVERQRSEKVIS